MSGEDRSLKPLQIHRSTLLLLVCLAFFVVLTVVKGEGFDGIIYLALSICLIYGLNHVADRYTQAGPVRIFFKVLAFAWTVLVLVYVAFAAYLALK
jgi:hypothetical protein